ncbi:unnamed protein product [Porites lobata]|uniref:Uncharacterized protein n=1 Tax=Porites lobata TaxID=104759 RepID=A0ABN8NWF5_9CNID|nr:unnamed protein product [Porites lobata]
MGNSITQSIKEQQDKNELEVTETLQMMHKMMENRIAAASSQMENEAIEDKTLPIVAIVDKSMKYLIKVSSKTSDEVSNAIDEILSGDFLAGLKSVIKVGLDAMLGNVSAGKTEKRDFHVVFANNSLLRIDYMCYKNEFSSTGIKDEVKNAFCYYLQVGVLDLEKVNPQILLYELTRAIGESMLPQAAKHLQGLATFAKDLYKVLNDLDRAAVGSLEGAPSKPNTYTFSTKEKEEIKKKALLARYHNHKHTPFFKRPPPSRPSSPSPPGPG